MNNRFTIIVPAALLCAGATTASAALISAEMFQLVGDPAATWGAPIATLDVNVDTIYNWSDGYKVSFPNGLGQDITSLTSRVYNVSSPMVLNQGADSLQLNVGDKVYAYTITLVENSATTVRTLEEFQVGLLSFVGGPIMDGSLIKGRGLVLLAGVNGPAGGNANDFEDLGIFGSSLDWQWPSLEANQLQNENSITLLMFVENSIPIDGIGDFRSPTGQIDAPNNVSNLVPVLVPDIPAPGAVTIGLIAGVLCTRRFRRGV